jgi:hypothetical protein
VSGASKQALTPLPRLLFVAVLAALALTVSAAPAAAKTPCWANVISDWYDNGRMDREYPISCYQEALRHLPQDIREYADAQDVISRAMTAAIANKSKSGPTSTTGNQQTSTDKRTISPVPPKNGPPGPGGPGSDGGNSNPHDSLFAKAFDRLGPGNANSIPVPLIVLGSLALLLLAAGAAGMVARKLQERRPQPATVPQRANDGPAL